MRTFARIALWLIPTFGLTRRVYRKTRDASENDGLRKFLLGLSPSESGCRYWVQGGPPKIILSGGSYELLFRFRDPDNAHVYVLNMDKPLADLPVPEWRERVLAAAANTGVEVLPVSERALASAFTDAGTRRPRLVVREGYEAVFTLGGAHYLSGYDQQENPPLYFLCQLPGPASSVGEARESLKPQSVKEALANGVRVQRQGDLFFIATEMSDDDLRIITDDEYSSPLYGTAHCATRVVQLPTGVMLASGVVRHKPEGRAPDHLDLALGGGWWLVARNTVPAERRTQQERPATTPVVARQVANFSDPFWALD